MIFLSHAYKSTMKLCVLLVIFYGLSASEVQAELLFYVVPADTLDRGGQPGLPADTLDRGGQAGLPADTLDRSRQPALPTDTLNVAASDTTLNGDAVVIDTEPPEDDGLPDFSVFPITLKSAPNTTIIETDSTLRWSQWLEWSDKLSRRPGAIRYGLGGFNRTDYTMIDGLGLRSQRLYYEGMSLENPVTGQPTYQHLSLERLASARTYSPGLTYRTDIEMLRYYIRRPRTRVRYEQGSFELRSTEAQIAQMISHQTGVELFYHGKNWDGEYNRSGTESRQISARVYHHISERYVAQAMINYNGVQLEESDGYQIQNLAGFNFSRFFATPVRTGARSTARQSQIQLALMRRAEVNRDSTNIREGDGRVLIYYNRYRRFYQTINDTSSYRYQNYNAAWQQQFRFPIAEFQTELRTGYFYTTEGRRQSLDLTNWSELQAELHGTLKPLPFLVDFPVIARFLRRTDGFNDWEVALGARFRLGSWLTVHGMAIAGQTAPTLQQLYWRGSVRGNPDLTSADELRYTAGFEFSPSDRITLGVSGFVQNQQHTFALGADSSFTQIPDVGQWGAQFTSAFEIRNFEITLNSTVQQYTSSNNSLEAQLLAGSGLRIWNRGSIHWQGYVLNNAAYIKTGFYGLFSPNIYRPARYIAVADYWEASQEEPEIPGFIRVDYDLSARVRTLMVLVRWENITQGLVQAGYYETAAYPMPSRRIRFGLRVYFTN